MSSPLVDFKSLLYHSAFYCFFLDTSFFRQSQKAENRHYPVPPNGAALDQSLCLLPRRVDQYFAVLRILGSIGCEVAQDVVNLVEAATERGSSKEVISSISSSSFSLLTAMRSEKTHVERQEEELEFFSSGIWMRLFQLASVAHLGLHESPICQTSKDGVQEEGMEDTEREDALLRLLQDVNHQRGGKEKEKFTLSVIYRLAEELQEALERRKGCPSLTNVSDSGSAPGAAPSFRKSASSVLFSWDAIAPEEKNASTVRKNPYSVKPVDRKRLRDVDAEENDGKNAETTSLSLQVAWLEGRLFAALSLLEGFTVTTSLAKMLVLYIYQSVPIPHQRRSSGFSSSAGRVEDEAAYRYARASGVVSGILEMALEISRSAVPRALKALHSFLENEEKENQSSTGFGIIDPEQLDSKKENEVNVEWQSGSDVLRELPSSSSSVSSFSTVSAYPLPEESNMFLVNTGILLTRLIECASTYENEEISKKEEEERTKSITLSRNSSSSSVSLTVSSIGEVVMHHMHMLVNALLTGCGTEHLERNESGSSSRGSVALPGKTSCPQSSSSRISVSTAEVGEYCRGAIRAQRGLVLAEADAVLAFIFPSLLQSVGYEWPWSETLRYFRTVENSQLDTGNSSSTGSSVSLYQHHLHRWLAWTRDLGSSSSLPSLPSFPSTIRRGKEEQKKGTSSPLLWAVTIGQWNSKSVVDALLIGCSKRAYPSRLYQLLPGSYHTMLDALGIMPAVPATEVAAALDEPSEAENGMDSISALTSTLAPPVLFTLPTYYDEVGHTVMKYWDRVGTIAAIQLEELDHLVHHRTVVLPMMVRIRAMAGSSSSLSKSMKRSVLGRNEDIDEENQYEEREEVLTPNVVEALIARYQAEVLLAAAVVYTQLTVPSQSQALLRVIAPLLERHLLTYNRVLGNVGSPPFPLFSASSASGVRHSPLSSSSLLASIPWRFSSVVQRVCGEAGYQLYTLEWLPQVGEMYLQHLQSNAQKNQDAFVSPGLPRGESIARFHSSTGLPYYSLFAAVAHQFRLSFRTPFGSSGGSTTRCVKSVLAIASGDQLNSVLMPPFPRASKEEALYSFPASLSHPLAQDSSTRQENIKWKEYDRRGEDKTLEYQHGRKRVERFAQLMQWIYLDMRTDVVASVQLAAERQASGGGVGSREEAFFHTFIEAKDFWQVVCQGFLPCVDCEVAGEGKNKQREGGWMAAALYFAHPGSSSSAPTVTISSSEWASRQLEGALGWCQKAIGGSSEVRWLNAALQQQQHAWGVEGRTGNVSHSGSPHGSDVDTLEKKPFFSFPWKRSTRFLFYDSATFDASLEARTFLRAVPFRLLEKWRCLRQAREEEKAREGKAQSSYIIPTSHSIGSISSPSGTLRELNTAIFLLQMQLRQWSEMSEKVVSDYGSKENLPFSEGVSKDEEQGAMEDEKWSIREWWWSSPLFFDELREV